LLRNYYSKERAGYRLENMITYYCQQLRDTADNHTATGR